MATYLADFVQQLDEKWREIDILLEEAESKEKSGQEDAYNALCRSVTVLIVAHLEGFVKGLAKSVIRDLGKGLRFCDLPESVKRTYAASYVDDGESNKANEAKTKALIEKFSDIDAGISYEPFVFSSNKNPKPSVVAKIFDNFGVNSVFGYIDGSAMNEVFAASGAEIKSKIRHSKIHIEEAVQDFPYSCHCDRLRLYKGAPNKSGRSLWEAFIDEINQKRHEVAHGNEFGNSESLSVLSERKDKVVYLQLGLVELLASVLISKLSDTA